MGSANWSEVMLSIIPGVVTALITSIVSAFLFAKKLRSELSTKRDFILKDQRDGIILNMWEKTFNSYRLATYLSESIKSYPSLNQMSDKELNETLMATGLTKSEKEEILVAQDKIRAYGWVVSRREIKDANESLIGLQVYLNTNRLFIPEDIVKAEDEFIRRINLSISNYDNWLRTDKNFPEMLKASREEIKKAKEKYDEIEDLSRKLF